MSELLAGIDIAESNKFDHKRPWRVPPERAVCQRADLLKREDVRKLTLADMRD